MVRQKTQDDLVDLIRNLKQTQYINQDICYQLAKQTESRTITYKPADTTIIDYPYQPPTSYHILISDPTEKTLQVVSKPSFTDDYYQSSSIELANQPPVHLNFTRLT